MITYILIGLAVLVVLFVIVVATRPDEYRVSRSTTIAAPPAVIFEQINDLHKWRAWSPWEKIDPALQRTYEGAPAGVGAVYRWKGNNKVGEGSMAIAESRPNESVKLNLEFLKPFQASNTAVFDLKPQGDQTLVTWSMEGKRNFMFKAVGLFVSCDKMLGGQFEQGLAQLKTVAEGEGKK